MKQKISILLLFSLSLLSTTNLIAQSSVNNSGNTANGSGGNSSYSVGQIMYSTQTGSSGTLVDGVQQPSEISIVLSIVKNQKKLDAVAFPNPTVDVLKLAISGVEITDLSYRITDMNGKTVASKKITKENTTVPMQDLSTATYLVSILKNKKKLKTFKIFKN